MGDGEGGVGKKRGGERGKRGVTASSSASVSQYPRSSSVTTRPGLWGVPRWSSLVGV